MIRRALFVVACAVVAAGCNGGSTSPPPFFTGAAAPTLTPSPTPMPQRLYVGNFNPAPEDQINRYDLPITTGGQSPSLTFHTRPFRNVSPPVTNVPAPGQVIALGLDATGNLGVGLFDGTLLIYNAPLSGASTPAATFPNGGTGHQTQIAFTPAGDFFVGAGNRVNMFTHPFSNASTPSSSITNPALLFAGGVVLDAAQNLYIVNNSGYGTGGNLLVYAPPYSGAPTITALVPGTFYGGSAISATQLFVTSDPSALGQLGQVDVYNLPITAASVPAFAITNGVNLPKAVAVDAAGNLYVGNIGTPTVTVYARPFSAASSPTMWLLVHGAGATLANPFGGASFWIFSVAVGR
jgi:hypothetical protein